MTQESGIPKPKTIEEIEQDEEYNREIYNDLIELQNKSNAEVKVGCVVVANEYRSDGRVCGFKFFGCNIHVSDSFGDTHAERMAIDLAIKSKCFPISVYVTSMSVQENVALCGSCRHYISEINENCNIIIFNPDGSIKKVTTVKDVYPFAKKVRWKNKGFFQYCGGKNESSTM